MCQCSNTLCSEKTYSRYLAIKYVYCRVFIPVSIGIKKSIKIDQEMAEL